MFRWPLRSGRQSTRPCQRVRSPVRFNLKPPGTTERRSVDCTAMCPHFSAAAPNPSLSPTRWKRGESNDWPLSPCFHIPAYKQKHDSATSERWRPSIPYAATFPFALTRWRWPPVAGSHCTTSTLLFAVPVQVVQTLNHGRQQVRLRRKGLSWRAQTDSDVGPEDVTVEPASESVLSAEDCQERTLCTSTSVAAALDSVSPAIASVLENRSGGSVCEPKNCHQWWRPKRDSQNQNIASEPRVQPWNHDERLSAALLVLRHERLCVKHPDEERIGPPRRVGTGLTSPLQRFDLRAALHRADGSTPLSDALWCCGMCFDWRHLQDLLFRCLHWKMLQGGAAKQDAANGTASAEVPAPPEEDDGHADELVNALGEEDALPEGDVQEVADQTDQQEAMQEETPEEVSLTNGMGKLQTAMQKRDTKKAAMKKPAASAALQAKPKGKAMKATKKASVMKSHVKAAPKAKAKACLKSKTMPQAKACPNVKAAAKKKAAPRQLKMTRQCVYSRAYHLAASKLQNVKGITEDQKIMKARQAGKRAVKAHFGSITASWLNASILVASLHMMSSHARFEYASIGWSTMEGLRTPDEWQRWCDSKAWTDLPRGQEMRHRCMDGVVYMGNGAVSHLYSYIQRENVDVMPGYALYLANDGLAMIVKPSANYGGRGGLKLFEFDWKRSEPKQVNVVLPLTGQVITAVPGRWGPRSTFWEVFDAFIAHCDMSEHAELQLGSLQVKAMAKGRPLGSMCKKLQLQEIFENMDRVRQAELEGQDADRKLAEQLRAGGFIPRSMPHVVPPIPKTRCQPKKRPAAKQAARQPVQKAAMKKPAAASKQR
eukprot:s2819_g8.t1